MTNAELILHQQKIQNNKNKNRAVFNPDDDKESINSEKLIELYNLDLQPGMLDKDDKRDLVQQMLSELTAFEKEESEKQKLRQSINYKSGYTNYV